MRFTFFVRISPRTSACSAGRPAESLPRRALGVSVSLWFSFRGPNAAGPRRSRQQHTRSQRRRRRDRSLLRFGGGVLGFLLSGAAKHPAERVVALVARVLVEVLVRRVPRILARPRAIPRPRIVD